MSVSLNRTFAGETFDPARVRTAIESLSRELVIEPAVLDSIGSVVRPSGAEETLSGDPFALLPSLTDGVGQSLTVDWRASGEYRLEVNFHWQRLFGLKISSNDETSLKTAAVILIRDLGLTPLAIGSDVLSRHVGDALAEALRAHDEVLWSRWVQSGRDLADLSRLSYHGPVHDMRDVLASVLRGLAPDDVVKQQSWFKQAPDVSGATQSQRAHYALSVVRQGGRNSTTNADSTIKIIGDLVRDVYSRGSAAHAVASRNEGLQIRRYASALLGDLLGVDG